MLLWYVVRRGRCTFVAKKWAKWYNKFLSMKKLLPILLIALVLCAVSPVVAFASDDVSHATQYVPSHKQYAITTLVENGKCMGAKFFGNYFGKSNIQVVVEIYSSSQLVLDFNVGEDENLSSTQKQNKQKLIELAEAINNLINQVDRCANTTYNGQNGLPLSDICNYNQAVQGQKLQISSQTYQMLKIAKQMYFDTDGAFNPAVYRLVDLWGFSSRIYSNGMFDVEKYPYDRPVSGQQFATSGYPLPEQMFIDAFSQPQFVNFGDDAVILTQQGDQFFIEKQVAPVVVDGVEYQQWLDLGGIAKGFVVDEIASLLQGEGLQNYYVDAGSSSSAFGKAQNGKQVLSLTDPFAPYADVVPQLLFGFEIDAATVSTSGQYVRKYVTNGVEYSHIIDGTTGAPAQTGVKMVSVVVPQTQGLWAGKGDCLTTALTVMGKDQIVQFVNGYLKDNEITVVVLFETFDGKQEIISNISKSAVVSKGKYFQNYAWTLSQNHDGDFAYVGSTILATESGKTLKVIGIVLACLCGAGLVTLLLFHVVTGKKNALQLVQYAKNDKPFKAADVGVYLIVALVIVVLFGVFFADEKQQLQKVVVTDTQNGEQLFLYNALRDEFYFNSQNSNGWQMQTEQSQNCFTVTFWRQIDDEKHFNTLKITTGREPSVKMVDSVCGFHQDCVHNFGKITQAGGVVVCSPNQLKVTTE